MSGIINYGFGAEYLPKWGIKEALREIYQNYLDYGTYKEVTLELNINFVRVTLSNSYSPTNLEFLRIGNSDKQGNTQAIGSHGEGLKMAFLIFLRNNLNIRIITSKYVLYPKWTHDDNIGDTLSIIYKDIKTRSLDFSIIFECSIDDYNTFISDIITPKDVIYHDSYHGDIISRKQGNIYSGGLFVCNLPNLSNSYNIPPARLPLDRDRSMPRTWDINYHSSKVNEGYARWTTKDTSFFDTMFISEIPQHVKEQFTPVLVGDTIEFTTKDESGNTNILKNDSIKSALLSDSYFSRIITSIKRLVAKKLGLYDMLIEFEKKHVYTTEAKQDFALILERLKPN